MFSKSKISVRGRWVVFAIFVVCVLLPEALTLYLYLSGILPGADPVAVVGLATIRMIWVVPMFYFIMMGHDWARYIAIAMFGLSLIASLAGMNSKTVAYLIVPTVLLLAAIGTLLFAKSVHPRRRY